ncbi:MAG: hypothetical protein ABR576_12395 [Thermoanaerobaculia bacterium]
MGNSLTYWNEMPWLLEQIAGDAPGLAADFVGGGGMTLRQHWDGGRALRAIRQGRWDYVALQGQSTEPRTAPHRFARYARMFDEEIRRRGAKTIFFVAWAPKGEPQAPITERYLAVARETGALAARVDVAWQDLRKRGFALYDGSGLHPSFAGSYLSACVFYGAFTGKTPVGRRHRFEVDFEIDDEYRADLESNRLSAADALQIQKAAWEAVRGAKSGDERP